MHFKSVDFSLTLKMTMFEIFRFLSKAQNDKHLFVILTCQNDKIRRHRKVAANRPQVLLILACIESANRL